MPCRVNDCERDGVCNFTCRDCGGTYQSDERECPHCALRSAMQFFGEGCEHRDAIDPRQAAHLSDAALQPGVEMPTGPITWGEK